jgi:hypothetical protein
LEQLRRRQAEKPVVDSIADILIEQFSGISNFPKLYLDKSENEPSIHSPGDLSRKWREAYGTFCSQHNESVALYKDLLKSDRQFQQFVKQCSLNPLLKKKGVPECILFVTTRITKYPLLIEPLVKTARDLPVDQCALKEAHVKVRQLSIQVLTLLQPLVNNTLLKKFVQYL